MNNKLQVILDEQGIEKSDVAKMVEAFGGPFKEAGEILATYKEIKVTDSKDVTGMQKAREARLLLKKARTTVENSRKELKADIVKQGRAIDSVARYVKEEIEPAENYLQLQEDFAKIEAEGKALKLKNDRIEKLMQYTNDISVYNLDAMTDLQFDGLLATLKAQHEAEIKRIADEETARIKAEAEEQKRIADQAKENKRLREEADKREAEIEHARVVAENERKLEAEKQAKKDAEAKAEQDRIQAEADAKVEAERKKTEALEQEKRDREEAERKAKEAEEAKEREALLAPDKKKLNDLADMLGVITLPAVKSNKAQELINYVQSELNRLEKYLNEKAKEL